jgi:hypothetical protein
MSKGKILTCVVTGALVVEAPPTVQTLWALLQLAPALEALETTFHSGGLPVPNKPAEPGMPGTGRAVEVALTSTAYSGTVQVYSYNTVIRAEYRKPQPFDVTPVPAKSATESSA